MLAPRPRTLSDVLDYCLVRYKPEWKKEDESTLLSFLKRQEQREGYNINHTSTAIAAPGQLYPDLTCLANDLLLFSYMRGLTAAHIYKNEEKAGDYVINTIDDLHILRPTTFGGLISNPRPKYALPKEQRLLLLFSYYRTDRRHNGRKGWSQRIDTIGADEAVVSYLGQAVTHDLVRSVSSPIIAQETKKKD